MSKIVRENGCNNHLHTTYSDGSLTAEQLIELAKEKKLKSITITEHNLFNPKIPELRTIYEKDGIEILNGIEFSVAHKLESGKTKELHIVCMLFDEKHPAFQEYLAMYEGREAFIRELLRRLEEKGMKLEYNELVKSYPDTKALGVVHVAEMLVKKNYVKDIDEAMDYVGSKGARICYVNKAEFMKFPSLNMCIKYIKAFKGFPIYAHPFYPTDITEEERIEMIDAFKKAVGKGNGGIEVYYKDYTPEMENWILEQAGDDLLPSCGSDFHGIYVDDRFDNYDYAITDAIKKRHQEMYWTK